MLNSVFFMHVCCVIFNKVWVWVYSIHNHSHTIYKLTRAFGWTSLQCKNAQI